MLHFSRFKIVVMISICLAGVIFSLPNLLSRAQLERMPDWLPKGQMLLGLDLQGGSQIVLEVGLDAVIEERMASLADDVRGLLDREEIEYGVVGSAGDSTAITLLDPGKSSEVLRFLATSNNDVFTPDLEISDSGNGRIEIQPTEVASAALREEIIDQSIEVVYRRIDEIGLNKPTIRIQEGRGDRILVDLPGEWDPAAIEHLLEQPARLSIHLVDEDNSVDEALSGKLPVNSMLLPSEDSQSQSRILVRKRIEVDGEHVIDAYPSFDANAPAVSFVLDKLGARRFRNATGRHVGDRLAIVVDERVISTPRINEPIPGGSGIISGNFSIAEATEFALLLRAGALPAPLTVIEMSTGGS